MPDARPKVAFLLRGVPQYRLPLYEQLAKRDQLDFCVFRQQFGVPVQDLGFSEAETDHLGWVEAFPMTSFSNAFFKRTGIAPPNRAQIKRVLEWQPDIIVLEGLSSLGNAVFAVGAIQKARIPFIWWTLGSIPGLPRGIKQRIGERIQRWFLKRASAVLGYSTHAAQVAASLGAEVNRIVVGFNTLDEGNLLSHCEDVPPETIEQLRNQFTQRHPRVMMFCGTINTGKRLDVLLRAIALIEENERPYCVVVGDGPDLVRCKSLSASYELSANVEFVGRKESGDVSAYMLASDFLVLPGLGGLAINHAFAHRLPVLCGPADGCEKDLVTPGETGFRLDVVTPESFADGIRRMCNEDLAAMGARAFEKITREITLDRYAQAIEEVVTVGLSPKDKQP